VLFVSRGVLLGRGVGDRIQYLSKVFFSWFLKTNVNPNIRYFATTVEEKNKVSPLVFLYRELNEINLDLEINFVSQLSVS